ncbi:MAG: type transport system ATP-binding protein, partial [Blastocatellia bacterium]|nr:type transport system ATP-binding protein [Blastocatellia bacterium]
PSAGEVEVLGERVGPGTPPALVRVGALVVEPACWRYLSGRTNLEYFARAGGPSADTRGRLGRIEEALARVGLTDAADKKVRAYSQGMRQRLGIALALLGRPDLLVLDEPTNGLDPTGMREMRGLLRELADGGTTVFVSSHLLSEVETMCDRVGVMARGRLVAEGPPGTLRGAVASYRLEVDDAPRALEILQSLPGIVAEAVPGGVRVRASHGAQGDDEGDAVPADVNAALVVAGIRVSALVPERDTLEDAFLSLVEGADVPR